MKASSDYPELGPFWPTVTVRHRLRPATQLLRNGFVVPGPGCAGRDRKLLGRSDDGIEAEIIRYMAETQQGPLHRLGLFRCGLRAETLQR